ncbi:DUF4913 domain-containing protein [Nocardia sp. NPDC058176]|uniref:DUF4913 domain-containing protein n=1 Tax=Nocardia sp. NPDC058176 TaxID=3346368 RepID=UPI0036DA8DCD
MIDTSDIDDDFDDDLDDDDLDDEDEAPELHFATVDLFVEWVAGVHARDIMGNTDQFRWCPEWWRHAEAVTAFEALWRAWEHHRQNPGPGMASWWVQIFWPAMDRLLQIKGTFEHCRDAKHNTDPEIAATMASLPLVAPPPGLFDNPETVSDTDTDTDDDDDTVVDLDEDESEPYDDV